MTITRPRFGLLAVIYLAVGIAVASGHHYFANVDTIHEVVSAALAIALWPLVLLGASLHIHP